MDLTRIKDNFNRGRMNIDDIKELIETVDQLSATQDLLFEDNKQLRRKIRELRQKTSFRVYEENLKLAVENARLEGLVKV